MSIYNGTLIPIENYNLIYTFFCKSYFMAKITFIQADGEKKIVEAENGKTLLEVAKENDIALMGACDGACACGTCHVYIDEQTLSKIEKPKEDEENVLDIVFNVQQNSRLACQVVVSDEMDGAIITIPE